MGEIRGMQIIHTKDYVPACTSNLCGFKCNTHRPTSALMEYHERSDANVCWHTTEFSFTSLRFMWQDNQRVLLG